MKAFTENEKSKYSGKYNNFHPTPEAEWEWAETRFKCCTKCLENKNLNCYAFNTSGRDPFDKKGLRLRRPECKDCGKKLSKGKAKAKKDYGLFTTEGKKCEICEGTENLVFDHHHETEQFRGFLCNNCNKGIGLCGETFENLLKRLNYLALHEGKKIIVEDI